MGKKSLFYAVCMVTLFGALRIYSLTYAQAISIMLNKVPFTEILKANLIKHLIMFCYHLLSAIQKSVQTK